MRVDGEKTVHYERTAADDAKVSEILRDERPGDLDHQAVLAVAPTAEVGLGRPSRDADAADAVRERRRAEGVEVLRAVRALDRASVAAVAAAIS